MNMQVLLQALAYPLILPGNNKTIVHAAGSLGLGVRSSALSSLDDQKNDIFKQTEVKPDWN